MKPLKHSKLKNTGVLFELLMRQVASDTLNNIDSKAVPIIKKYFGKSAELSKELRLYQTLTSESLKNEEKAKYLIDVVVNAHKQLNQAALNRQKFNLIKEIKSNYVLEDFFKSKVNHYKQLASVFKLFEYTAADNPIEFVNNRFTLIEHISRASDVQDKSSSKLNELSDFVKQDKDVRLLSYKILVDKFNEKYSDLNEGQKSILRNYIYAVSDGTELTKFVQSEATKLQKELKSIIPGVTDKVVQIKLNEVKNLLTKVSTTKTVHESHILNLLRYHELIKELKKI